MYFSRRKLCLFILILAQIVNILGQTEECAVQTIIETTSAEQETNEVPTEEGRNDEIFEDNIEPIAILLTANSSSSNNTKVNCFTHEVYGRVEIVNATRLAKLLSIRYAPLNKSRSNIETRRIPGKCILVLFHSKWCMFSSQAAPHFNALPRLFPHIKAVAIDATLYQNLNAQYGIVGVPTLMLVHNGKSVIKFNDTVYTVKTFTRFITEVTNLQPNGPVYVTSRDYEGPVSSRFVYESDYCLLLSWVFIAACALYFTLQSRWWQQFVELVQNTWRESNAQHEHAD